MRTITLGIQELAVRERREDEARWDQYLRTGEAVPNERVKAWLTVLACGTAGSRSR